jgi:ATP-dependent helicase/nuclease subunit B
MKVEFARYGAEALAALRRTVATIKTQDPMTPTTVLVPSNVAGIAARRHLAAGLGEGCLGIAAIDVTTLGRVAERLAAAGLAPRRPVTPAILMGAWRTALADAPGLFATVADHPATVQALVAAHRTLRQADDDAQAAIERLGGLPADVVRLHRMVQTSLRPAWYDPVDLLEAAACGRRFTELGSVVVYLPQDLTAPEVRLVDALADASSDVVVICGLTGARRADRVVTPWLPVHVTVPDAVPIATATRMLNASDSDDEVRCVVRQVVQHLQHTPAHRVAVLYTRQSPYARLLHEHLAAADVTVNGPGPRTVGERALGRALLGLLMLGDRNVPRAELFRVLSEAPARDFTGGAIPVARWERTSRSAGVVQGDDWDVRLRRLIAVESGEIRNREASEDPQPWRIERSRQVIASAEGLRSFVGRLRLELASAEQQATWRGLAEWAGALFAALYGDPERLRRLPAEEQYAAATITTTLAALANLDSVDSAPSLERLREVLELALNSALPRVGRFGDGVYVGPLDGAVGLDLDVVFPVGLSEDLYPGRVQEDALLPERAREVAGGQLPSPRDEVDRQHRMLLAALASAPTAIASFPRGDLRRSTDRIPSRFILPSLRHLRGDHRLAATEWEGDGYGEAMASSSSFAGELRRTPVLAHEQEWRIRSAVAGLELADPVVQAGQEMIRARAGTGLSRFDGNLLGVEGLPDYAEGDLRISPTALESYAACPHAFFVRRLLGVEPLEQPEDIVEISRLQVGTLIHTVMDRFVSEHAATLPEFGQPWSPQHRKRLLEIAGEVADAMEQEGLTGHPRLWARERYRIFADLTRMLDEDDRWHRRQQTRVRVSEMAFGMHGQPPVSVPLARGRLLMRGSADRVDESRDGTLIVTDIKTGDPKPFGKITDADPFVGGTKLQLPAYALAARQRLGTDETPVPTQYWFVRRKGGRVGIDLTPDLARRYAETVGVLVDSIAAGLFPPKAPESADYLWVQCVYCNPDGAGYGELRKDWERKRLDAALQRLLQIVEPASLKGQP